MKGATAYPGFLRRGNRPENLEVKPLPNWRRREGAAIFVKGVKLTPVT